MERNMNRKLLFLSIVLALFMTAFPSITCFAQEPATRDECISKVAKATNLIQEIGTEAAFNEIVDQDGPFIWKDAHVFCINTKTGILLAHLYPAYVGTAMLYYSDADGGYPYARILDLLKIKKEGWITYISDRMGKDEPRLKHMHFRKVPGEDIVVCSGYYPEQVARK